MKRAEKARALQQQHHFDADERAQHKDLAMGEVDELEDAVNHRIAERDQRVHEAQNETVQEYLREDFQCEFQERCGPFKVRHANK